MALLCVFLTSCPPDPDIHDQNAGTFIIKNTSTGETIDGNNGSVREGDILSVEFLPKAEYSDMHFTTKTTVDGEVINGKYYTVSGSSSEIKIDLTASYNGSKGNTDYYLSAARTVVLSVSKKTPTPTPTPTVESNEYADITFLVVVSADLFTFVRPEISYIDADGNRIAVPQTDGDWEYDSIIFDGEELAARYRYEFELHYPKIGFGSEVAVTYQPNYVEEFTKESFYFSHSLSLASASTVKDFNVKIFSFTNFRTDSTNPETDIKKEDVRDYLDQLVSTPDVLRFSVNEDGTLSKVE